MVFKWFLFIRRSTLIVIGSLEKGDSPRCGEMSRSDKGDGLPSGAGREFTSGLRD